MRLKKKQKKEQEQELQVNLEEEEEEEEGFSRKSGQVGRNSYSIWSYIHKPRKGGKRT